MGNRYLTVNEIHQEEERWCQEIEGEKRACKKCKYEAALPCNVEAVADTLEDDDSLSAVGCQELASTCIHVHKVDYSTAHNADLVRLASQQQQQSITILDLQQKVVTLTKQLCQMQQNAQHWKQKYLEKVSVDETVQSGVHLVESASKGVEELMYSEESYLQAAGWRSEKANREYRKAIGLSDLDK